MDKLKRILNEKKLQGKTWSDLADVLPVSGEGLRIAFTRNSVSEIFLDEIERTLGIKDYESPSSNGIPPKKDEDLKRILNEIERRKLTANQISKQIPISEVGINRLIKGKSKNPQRSTILLLKKFLFSEGQDSLIDYSEIISKAKNHLNIKWTHLAEYVPMDSNALRVAVSRGALKRIYFDLLLENSLVNRFFEEFKKENNIQYKPQFTRTNNIERKENEQLITNSNDNEVENEC